MTKTQAWIGKGLTKYQPNPDKLLKLNKRREQSVKQIKQIEFKI